MTCKQKDYFREGGTGVESREGQIKTKYNVICMNVAVENIISHVNNNKNLEH